MSNLSIEHNVLASTQNRLATNFIPRCLSKHHTWYSNFQQCADLHTYKQEIIYQQKYDKCNKQQTVAIASGVSIVIG